MPPCCASADRVKRQKAEPRGTATLESGLTFVTINSLFGFWTMSKQLHGLRWSFPSLFLTFELHAKCSSLLDIGSCGTNHKKSSWVWYHFRFLFSDVCKLNSLWLQIYQWRTGLSPVCPRVLSWPCPDAFNHITWSWSWYDQIEQTLNGLRSEAFAEEGKNLSPTRLMEPLVWSPPLCRKSPDAMPKNSFTGVCVFCFSSSWHQRPLHVGSKTLNHCMDPKVGLSILLHIFNLLYHMAE